MASARIKIKLAALSFGSNWEIFEYKLPRLTYFLLQRVSGYTATIDEIAILAATLKMDFAVSIGALIRVPENTPHLTVWLFPIKTIKGRKTHKPDRRGQKPDRRQAKRRLDDKTKARLKR